MSSYQCIFSEINPLNEYQQLVTGLDDLSYLVGEDENHPLASMMEVVGVLIEAMRMSIFQNRQKYRSSKIKNCKFISHFKKCTKHHTMFLATNH